MPRQQIIWTALPDGRRRDGARETLRLSVVVAPRLQLDGAANGGLQAFADFLDWPAHSRQHLAGFDLIVDDDETRPIPATVVSPAPDSDLWKALFPATTLVRSRRFEGDGLRQPIASYPVSAVTGELQAGYGQTGRDAPFRSSDKATLKRNFAGLAEALSPGTDGTRLRREDLREARAMGAPALRSVHRALAGSLLRADPDLTFDEKLAAAIDVAGALSRSAPPGQAVPLVAPTGGRADGFTQLAAFHRRLDTPARSRDARDATGRSADDEMDFHQMLTALGDYAWLLRRLGLTIDLEVDASLVPRSSIGALRRLRVRPRLTPAAPDGASYTPVTMYILDDTIADNPLPFPVFLAAPRRAAEAPSIEPTLEIVGGLLNLQLRRSPSADDLQFDVVSVDVDGAVRKVLNTIRTIVSEERQQGAPVDATTEMAPPSLQTSGLNLVRAGQADVLMAGVAAAHEHEADRVAGRRAVLFAEDLVRGYRIDVRRFSPGHQPGDPEPPWLSLHHRVGSFRFKRAGQPDITVANVADEGFVQPVLVQEPRANPQDPNETNPIYIHESYAHWQGWSLSAPFPADPLDLDPGRPQRVAGSAGLLGVEMTMEAAPGTLPRLRFGHEYQLRARTVDLAGNGLTVDGASAVLATLAREGRPEPYIPVRRQKLAPSQQELPFRRFDPIASPALVLREELLEGEAVDVMVIRSNGAPTTTAGYARSLGDRRYQGFNERHVVPPKASQRMAEHHGRLDGAFGIGGEPLKLFATTRRAAGTLNDPFVTNLRTGEPEPLPDVVQTDPVTGARTTIRHGLRFVEADQSAPGEPSGYTIHYEEQLRPPYLPDPLAQGAALFGLPGVNNESLVLVEGATPGTPGRLESRRNEAQLLPQQAIDALGLVTKIGFAPGAWPDLRPFRLRLDGLDPAGATAPTWSEQNGARLLTVRLAPAEARTVWVSTFPGKDDAGLFGLHFWWARLGAPEGERHFLNMAQHGALAMLTPARKVVLVHAVQQPLMAPQADGTAFAVRKFADETVAYIAGRFKIHGGSTEKLDLLASWSEPLQESEGTRRLETHVLEAPIRPSAEPPSIDGNPVPIGTYTKGTDRFEFHAPATRSDVRARSWLARHEFGDTRHRRVSYRLVATTRFKDYFPDRITRDTANLVRTTTFENVVVRNSARPPALEISSIVPAFRWDRNFDLTSSTRSGGRLRVYLGPRWFATGEGETVAVVGDPVGGADPVHAVPLSGGPGTITPKGGAPVAIAGQPGLRVHPFPVEHDPDLGLWYVDLAFDVTGLYFPFIGLRLARFQEQSVDGLQLSPVVDAGFYQLLPDRAVALARFDVVEGHPDKRRIEITVSGSRAAAGGSSDPGRLGYSVEVGVEERALGGSGDQRDPDLGWKPSATVRPVVATGPSAPAVLWRGSVLVPAVADMERRIVVKEFELFPPNSPPPGQAWSSEPAGGPSRRLVYADVIAVR